MPSPNDMDADLIALDLADKMRGTPIPIVDEWPEDVKLLMQLVRDFGGDSRRMLSEIYSPPRVTAAAKKLPKLWK